MDVSSQHFATPLPNHLTAHHFELHNLSVRESRPIIEFEYEGSTDTELVLTVFGRARDGLLADLTHYLQSTSLSVRQAIIYTLPNDSIMDQFALSDPNHVLQDDTKLKEIHDTLVQMIESNTAKLSHRQSAPVSSHQDIEAVPAPSQSNDSLYNYALLSHRVPISLLPPRAIQRQNVMKRLSSNLALTELQEEQRMESEKERRKSEAVTANFVEDAISSLVDGDHLYHYSSDTRYRHRFHLSEDKSHLCWGEADAVRLSRFAGVLFGPKSAVFQDLGSRLVDPEWLCFSLVADPLAAASPRQGNFRNRTIDLVCVSIDQLNRWLLGLQSLCNRKAINSLQRLTLDDITKMRVIYKIRSHAHARGLTVRKYFLKRVRATGEQIMSRNADHQHSDEVKLLEAELARLQKTLIDSARRETLLNTSLRDFQHSWEIDMSAVQLVHPIGQGAFSEMWKGIWRSTPVAVKKLTTRSVTEVQLPTKSANAPQQQATVNAPNCKAPLDRIEDLARTTISAEDRRVLHDFRLEVTMLNKLRHPNIVLFVGACTALPNLCILTEFCHGGSLFAALRKRSWRTCLSLQDLRNVARHMARGMRYLHALHIIHRDLKSQNLLLDRPVEEGWPVVKIADFGLSRNFRGIGTVTGSVSGIMTSETGTYRWMAPEMIRHEPYNERVDVYSYGVVLWELFSCEVPFSGMTPIQAAFAVADKHLRPKCESAYAKDVKIPDSWMALISQCWHPTPRERPSFSEVLDILDEMDAMSENEIPNTLREVARRKNRTKYWQRVPAAAAVPAPAALGAGGDRERIVNEHSVLDMMTDLQLNRDEAVVRSGAVQTGLEHSGSAPNLTKLA